MSSSELPTPSLDEIKTWDEYTLFEHFRHPALRLKPEHATILLDQEVDGNALVQLTKEDLLGPPYNLPGGPVAKIVGEISRLRGCGGQQGYWEATDESAAEARIKRIETEIDELMQKFELVALTTDEKEKDRLGKERIQRHERECRLLDILKDQLRAPPYNLALDIKNNIEDKKNDTRDILSSLDEIRGKVDSLPKLMLDLHEDTVPRLFFIFPEDGHWWSPSIDVLFTKTFRLYFLCEHETIENGTTKKQFHLAYNDGYHVTRPREFVAKYGTYIRTIMPCLLLAVRLGGCLLECIPAFWKEVADILRVEGQITSTAYNATDSSIFMDRELEFCAQTELFFKIFGDKLGAMDNQTKKYMAEVPLLVKTQESAPGLMERPDLRKLQACLKGLNDTNWPGNLQRVLRRGENGTVTVRWVCKNHASEWETTNAVRSLYTAIKNCSINDSITFNNETWELTMKDLSERSLHTFRNLATRVLFDIPLRKISFIACNKVRSEDVEALFNAATTVEILEINEMKNIQIKNIVQKCFQLRTLNLSVRMDYYKKEHCIDEYEACALAEALKMNTSLQNLDLSRNDIGERGASALAEALKVNMSLQNLNLTNNYIGERGASALAEALKMNASLQNLDLTLNDIGEKGASALAEALKMNTCLQYLDISWSEIGEKGVNTLAKALKINMSLQTLDLSGSYIGEKGASSLAETLKMNTSLRNIGLCKNAIGEKGATLLTEALKMNRSLQTLDLEDNGIGEKGANALAEVLKTNTSLQNLDLSRNYIGGNGARTLAEALKINASLQILNLPYNGIGEKGANALAETLKMNTSLQNLNLFYNGIGEKGANALAKALKMNTSLQNLLLSENNIGEKGASALAEAWKVNTSLKVLLYDGM